MAKKLAPVHPGEVLKLDLMEPHGLSGVALAKMLKVPANRITEIVAGKRAMTADTALRLAQAFGVDAGFWLNLQSDYDIETAQDAANAEYRSIRRAL